MRDRALDADERRRFLGVVARNSKCLHKLVDDLLFVARIQANNLALELTQADLGAILRESVLAAVPAADHRGITLSLKAEASALEGDPTRLAQVVDNLVSNALEFAPAGGHVVVRGYERRAWGVVGVEDSGIRVPVAEQRRLFERFFRTSTATEKQIQGTGIGLYITKRIHGESISFDSEEGAGTTFRVTLPVAAADKVEPFAEPQERTGVS